MQAQIYIPHFGPCLERLDPHRSSWSCNAHTNLLKTQIPKNSFDIIAVITAVSAASRMFGDGFMPTA